MSTIRLEKQVHRLLSEAGGGAAGVASGLVAAFGLFEVLTMLGEPTFTAVILAAMSIWVSTHLKRTGVRRLALFLFWAVRGSVTMAAAFAHATALSPSVPIRGSSLVERAGAVVLLTLALEVSSHLPHVISSGLQRHRSARLHASAAGKLLSPLVADFVHDHI